MKNTFTSLKIFAFLTLITGVMYPLFVTVIAQIAFKPTADGSFVTHNGTIVGSTLIGQKFSSESYFWSRPSATDYTALPSGGSQLSPTSKALKEIVQKRLAKVIEAHGHSDEPVPSDLIYASGSGLDPHITLQAAHFQIDRVAKARGLSSSDGHEKLKNLILTNATSSLFGRSHINVLRLNMALDNLNQ